MPTFERDDIVIHYIERGEGFPILLFAPGGMRSAAGYWKNSPWNPVTELSDRYRVIAMDQRNAGKSARPSETATAGTPTRRTTSHCSTTSGSTAVT